MPPDPPGSAAIDDRLDFLIEQERRLFESDDQLQGAADGRTAVVVTAAITITGLSVAGWKGVAEASTGGKLGFAGVAVVAGVLALIRAGSGYFRGRDPLFSTHSAYTSHALRELRAREAELVPGLEPRDSPGEAGRGSQRPPPTPSARCTERQIALAVWRNKAIDARARAKRRERAAALAAVLLAFVLFVFGAVAFFAAI
jgi:hypothetical protein